MNHNIKSIKNSKLVLVAGLLICFSVSACSKGAASTPSRQQSVPNVKAVKSIVKPISFNVEYPSQLKAATEVNISPEISGKVSAINVDVGDQVLAGQVLFSIDDKDIQTQLKQQQASRDYYRVNLEKTKDSTVSQQISTAEQSLSKLETDYTTAKNNYENYLNLYQTGAVSLQTLSDYESKYKNLSVDLNSARENLRVLKEKTGPQSIDAASAQLNQADSAVESASQKLDNASVRSPMPGEVSARNISSGELVSTSTKAYTIIDSTSLIADVNVPFKMTQNVKVGQVIPIRLDSEKNKTIDAVVSYVSPTPDTTSQLYRIRAKVDNKNLAIKSGLLVRVQLPAEKKDKALTVPNQALKIENGLRYLYVVENGVVKKKNVITGLSDDKDTEITSNLQEGDMVLTEGQIFLNDGQKVNVANLDGQDISKNTSSSGQKPEGTTGNKAQQSQDRKPSK